MDSSLKDKTIVITGAAQGLGLGMAAELGRRGGSIMIADLQEEKAAAEAAKLRDAGLDVQSGRLDVTDSAQVDGFFESFAKERGHLDVLVNSAGLGQTVSHVVELSDEEWNRVLAVTLTGTFYTCRATGRIMERQESGSIVNISSINGQVPAALVAAYNVAKAGVISFTTTLAMELAPYGVRVNAVCPGPVYTDFNKKMMAERAVSLNVTEEDMIERIRGAVPLGRWGKPEDIARGVAYLAGPESSWVTGEVLTVSGGLKGVSAAPPKRAK